MRLVESFELFMPGELPPAHNGPGGLQRLHWAKLARVKRSWHSRVYLAWLAAGQPMIRGPVVVECVRWYAPTDRSFDPDNLGSMCKLPLDSLVKCGAIENDSARFIKDLTHYQDRVDTRAQVGYSFSVASVERPCK